MKHERENANADQSIQFGVEVESPWNSLELAWLLSAVVLTEKLGVVGFGYFLHHDYGYVTHHTGLLRRN